jgi:hypothetical protein
MDTSRFVKCLITESPLFEASHLITLVAANFPNNSQCGLPARVLCLMLFLRANGLLAI